MTIEFTGTYKSLEPFVWSDVPPLAVLTGKNGTGKSQLLELLHASVTKHYAHASPDQGPRGFCSFIGESFRGEDVVFLKSEWQLENLGSSNVGNIQMDRESLYIEYSNHVYQRYHRYGYPLNLDGYRRIKREYRDQHADTSLSDFFDQIYERQLTTGTIVTRESFLQQIPDKLLRDLRQQVNHTNLSKIVWTYRVLMYESLARGEHPDEFVKIHGPKPWEQFNNLLADIGLPFRLNDPESLSLLDAYTPTLRHTLQNKAVPFSDLSSGEKVLISLAFWILNAHEFKAFPKLLLLDEPDAHLHPSMSRQLINVLDNVLVKKYGVRVIMTTHSPSTVVMLPQGYLFEMAATPPRIVPSPAKNHTVSLLTEGLVYVGEGAQYILVEDRDDAAFYDAVYKYVAAENLIDSTIPLVFIPASTKESSGGKSVVEGWVGKLKESGLSVLIKGLIDEDCGNTVAEGIFKINRYSIENYLLDPIVTYAALIDKEGHDEVLDIGLKVGEEHRLRTLSAATLQTIADAVLAKVYPEVRHLFADFGVHDEEPQEISFVHGQILRYPKWLLKRRGKTLLQQAYNAALKSTVVNHTTLFKAMRKTYFIPTELLQTLIALRTSS